jgi:transcription-repair coupling factor (superfamily II helicase)
MNSSRGGQVFFVHNRVETIEKMARQLRELVRGVIVVWPRADA